MIRSIDSGAPVPRAGSYRILGNETWLPKVEVCSADDIVLIACPTGFVSGLYRTSRDDAPGNLASRLQQLRSDLRRCGYVIHDGQVLSIFSIILNPPRSEEESPHCEGIA